MATTIKINGEQMEASEVGIVVRKMPSDIPQAMRRIGEISMAVSVDLKVFARGMRKLMRSLGFMPKAQAAGYLIVNHRGRNKLVDIRRMRRGKA